jgi:ABC-type lipoprotein release transport system permease subunit
MTMLIKVAWRNIWRNRKRSLIIMMAVAIGLWSGIFLMAFYNGMIEQRINTAITRELSHLQLHHPIFLDDHDIQFTLPDGYTLLHGIQSHPDTKAASGRVILRGMIASATGSSGIQINGVMPEFEEQLTGLKKKLTQGEYFQTGKTNEIIISERTLHKLKLNLNKKTILTFQDKEGNLASAAFRICGIYKTINTPYDELNAFIDIKDIDSLAGIGGQLNEIAILLHTNDRMETLQHQLRQQHPDIETKNWMELSPELELTVSAGDQMVLIFMGIILLALAFGIINTMMMSILERTREIGMLMALGMNKLRIFAMILLETLFLILSGCPIGILLAILTIAITQKTGINLNRYNEVYSSFGYDPSIYPTFRPDQFTLILVLILVTALLSSLFPARKALTLKPAESIKK